MRLNLVADRSVIRFGGIEVRQQRAGVDDEVTRPLPLPKAYKQLVGLPGEPRTA